jgi:hypothetical protein
VCFVLCVYYVVEEDINTGVYCMSTWSLYVYLWLSISDEVTQSGKGLTSLTQSL